MKLRRQILAAVSAGSTSLFTLACTAVSTSTVAPTSQKCQISVTSGQTSFAAAGGTGSLEVTTARDCPWNVTAEVAWVQIAGEPDRQGEAHVPFSIAANPVPAPRSGSIRVGTQQLQVSQAAAPCNFQLSFTHKSVSAAGEQVAVGVTTLTGCPWRAESDASWIAIISGQSGNASGTVVLAVSSNSGAARNGQVLIGGQPFSVTQAAAPSPPTSPSPPPPNSPAPPSGQTVDFEGNVSGLSGPCPGVNFAAGGRQVGADRNTDYRQGRCSDLSNGDAVRVRGTTRADGGVMATRITFEDNHD